jgi:hypothetical protein
MKSATFGSIGSVHSASHREEDLIPAFISELDDRKEALSLDDSIPEMDRVKEVSRLDAVIADIEGRMYDEQGEYREDYWTSEEASYDLNETLFQELGQFAPPFCSFGAHEGDGADFGYWWSSEAFDDAVNEGTVLKVDELPDESEIAEMDKDVEYVAQVSDHGNVELYLVVRPAKAGETYRFENVLSIV